jgi:hypothetical protein
MRLHEQTRDLTPLIEGWHCATHQYPGVRRITKTKKARLRGPSMQLERMDQRSEARPL